MPDPPTAARRLLDPRQQCRDRSVIIASDFPRQVVGGGAKRRTPLTNGTRAKSALQLAFA